MTEMKISLTKINLYTIVQLVLLCLLLALKGSVTTAMLFPLGLLALIYVRVYLLPWLFTKKELNQLDPIVYQDHSD